MLVHASCVAYAETGILLRGPSGSGKSSLCLRLIDAPGFGIGEQALRAELVADDQVEISRQGLGVLASAPAALAGKLEIRGLGIVTLKARQYVALRLIVDLKPPSAIQRLPEDNRQSTQAAGITLPRLELDATAPAAPAILRAALCHFGLL